MSINSQLRKCKLLVKYNGVNIKKSHQYLMTFTIFPYYLTKWRDPFTNMFAKLFLFTITNFDFFFIFFLLEIILWTMQITY